MAANRSKWMNLKESPFNCWSKLPLFPVFTALGLNLLERGNVQLVCLQCMAWHGNTVDCTGHWFDSAVISKQE